MRIATYCILPIIILTACSSINPWDNNSLTSPEMTHSNVKDDDEFASLSTLEASKNFQDRYGHQIQSNVGEKNQKNNTNIPVKTINDYVRGIMQDLIINLQNMNASTPMAVSTFVFLDSDYSTSALLGKQLAESFAHEIHQYGIPVIDFKTTDYIRITTEGDFALSHDIIELTDSLSIDYVLTGTLVKYQGGVLVNARIVSMKSKDIVASAQGFLPAKVTDALLDSEPKDKNIISKENKGISLVKG